LPLLTKTTFEGKTQATGYNQARKKKLVCFPGGRQSKKKKKKRFSASLCPFFFDWYCFYYVKTKKAL
jgi:hypothetical protein